MLKKVGKGKLLIPAIDLINPIVDIQKSILDFLKIKEREETKREQVRTFKEVITRFIDFYGDKFTQILNIRREEREDSFNKYFKDLEKAIEKENPELVKILTQRINELHRDSIISKEDREAIFEDALKKALGKPLQDSYDKDDDDDDNKKLPRTLIW